MNTFLISVLGFIVGGSIGLAFGTIQQAAKRRYKKQKELGRFSNAWLTMPGSMSRVAYLLAALILIQIGCPLFFEGTTQWMVSTGVILGYGWILFLNFRKQPTGVKLIPDKR